MKTPGASLLALSLAGCMSVPLSYPDDWTPIVPPPASGACPALAGTYADVGEATSGCVAGQACARLSFGLFAAMIGFEDRASLAGAQVELRQPAPGLLEAIVRDGGREVTRGVLSAAKGDFECTRRGLTLRARGGRMVVAGGSQVPEQRTFNRARDGALVMSREAIGSGQGVVVPVGEPARYWVRWAARPY